MEQGTKITTKSIQNVGILELAGDVTSQAEADITDGIRKLEQEGVKKFLFKFNEATYINSSGLAIIISLVSEGKKKKQTFAASGMSKHFQKVFDVIGLTDYVHVYATENDALKKL